MVILDTCVLLWLAADQKCLSKKAIKNIKNNAGNLFVSSISAFEIAIKVRRGKIFLPMADDIWFKKTLDHHGVREIPINGDISFRSVTLPLLHNDPCDRFIIATALINSMPIITCDLHIKQYEEAKVIW